eukprot:6943038-Heterocapsa_arctica.AAC.1
MLCSRHARRALSSYPLKSVPDQTLLETPPQVVVRVRRSYSCWSRQCAAQSHGGSSCCSLCHASRSTAR